MKKVSLQYILLMALMLLHTGARAADKIGYVDMNILINNSPQITAANQSLTQEFEAQNNEISQQEADLQVMEDSIRQEGNFMTPDELAKLQERARILERQVRRAKEDLKDAITIRNSQLVDEVQNEIKRVVADYAKANGYDVILINAILYANERINITDEILAQLRQEYNNTRNP